LFEIIELLVYLNSTFKRKNNQSWNEITARCFFSVLKWPMIKLSKSSAFSGSFSTENLERILIGKNLHFMRRTFFFSGVARNHRRKRISVHTAHTHTHTHTLTLSPSLSQKGWESENWVRREREREREMGDSVPPPPVSVARVCLPLQEKNQTHPSLPYN